MNEISPPLTSFVRGVVHGKTIELEIPLNLRDGETVEVHVRVVPNASRSGEGILKTAGILGRDPEDDEILNYLHDLRRSGEPCRVLG